MAPGLSSVVLVSNTGVSGFAEVPIALADLGWAASRAFSSNSSCSMRAFMISSSFSTAAGTA